MTTKSASIAFRDHTGRTVASVLDRNRRVPRFIHRERTELMHSALPPKVYHTVADNGAPLVIIDRVAQAACLRTAASLGPPAVWRSLTGAGASL